MSKVKGQKSIEAVMRAINKRYGPGTIVVAGKAKALELIRIPSGSFSLDCELGGGWPRSRISTIVGEFSVGKSFLAYKAVAEAQRMFPTERPVWIDQEGVFQKEWAEKFGVILGTGDPKTDPENALLLVRPDSAEAALDIALEFIQTDGISIVIYDSLAANAPQGEIEKSMEEWSMGLAARLNNKFFRKAQALLNSGSLEEKTTKPAVIVLNQLRDTMDQYKPETMPGGRGQVYFSSIILKLRFGTRYKESRDYGAEDVYIGHEVKFVTEKNKTFAPKRQGSFDIYVMDTKNGFKAGDIDRLKEIVSYAIFWEVIRKSGSWFYVDGVEKPFHGGDELVNFFRDNPDEMAKVGEKVMRLAIGQLGGDVVEDGEDVIDVDDQGRVVNRATGEIIDDPTDDDE